MPYVQYAKRKIMTMYALIEGRKRKNMSRVFLKGATSQKSRFSGKVGLCAR